MLCWVDGKYLKETDLKISPFDYGFLYGYNIFEIFRTYQGKVVLFPEHFQRLIETLMDYHIHMPYTIDQLKKAIEELTRLDGADAIVHLIVSAGKDLFPPQSHSKPKVFILRRPLQKRENGEIRLKWRKIPPGSSFYGRKFMLPFEQWAKGVFYTGNHQIVSGLYSTIFWAKNGILYTPGTQDDRYSDITRKWVLLTARQLGIKVIEDVFFRKELEDAYECFITNAIDGIVPVSQVHNIKFLGKEGPIFEQIHHAYLEEIFQLIQGDRLHVGKI